MVAASCEPPSITIEPASTATAATFVIHAGPTARPMMIAAFRVDRCDAKGAPAPESRWLTMAPDTAEPISRITYGTPPAGWRSVQGPHPLAPGCYRAAVSNAPPLEFDVSPDGHVTARR
jgi:hypothetical protein